MTAAIHARPRLGIYGGTFAPPHLAHVRAACEFLDQASLDRLLVVPTYLPPHKRVGADDDPSVRLEMARAAFGAYDARIGVSDYEIRREGVSYTWQTLTHFAETEDAELFFLCGTDMFLTLWQWKHPEIIFRLSTIACMARAEGTAAWLETARRADFYRAQYGARILLLDGAPLPLSSSEIRGRVARGEPIGGLVPAAVEAIIRARGLYRTKEGCP